MRDKKVKRFYRIDKVASELVGSRRFDHSIYIERMTDSIGRTQTFMVTNFNKIRKCRILNSVANHRIESGLFAESKEE